MEAFFIISFTLLTFGAHASPWVFQEIKPLTEAGTVKKSNIPDKPVQDTDPTTPTIHIKQDIREDILGKNTSSTKFKEGVKKLLDFLEAGPNAIGENPKGNGTHHEDKESNKKDNRILKQSNQSLSYNQDKQSDVKQADGMNSKDLNSLANANHDEKSQKDSNSNFVTQQKEPPAIPIRSEINGNGAPPSHETVSLLHNAGMMDKDLHSGANSDNLSSFNKDNRDDKPLKDSNSKFVTQQKEPPAIPMRSEINSYGMFSGHATAGLLHNGMIMNKAGLGGNMVPKSQIPYSSIPYQAQLPNNAITRGNYKMPNPVRLNTMQYNPYSALYQRSSFLHHYGNYGVPQRPIPMTTQAYRYPYNQRRMLPLKPISFNPASRTNIRLPFYKSATLRSPGNNPRLRLPYSKTFVPGRPAKIPQKAPMSLFPARRSHIPTFQHFQISQPHHAYRPFLPKWNLLSRNTIQFKPARPRGIKYRRMAINDRGHSYNGLSSPRDKVTQKTPLPLPLASIMTAARIVVPARPHTLNGVFKSTVETMPSADTEEKGARAV